MIRYPAQWHYPDAELTNCHILLVPSVGLDGDEYQFWYAIGLTRLGLEHQAHPHVKLVLLVLWPLRLVSYPCNIKYQTTYCLAVMNIGNVSPREEIEPTLLHSGQVC